jgi:hypothetical protein
MRTPLPLYANCHPSDTDDDKIKYLGLQPSSWSGGDIILQCSTGSEKSQMQVSQGPGISSARKEADSELKKTLAGVDPEDFRGQSTTFEHFIHWIKLCPPRKQTNLSINLQT